MFNEECITFKNTDNLFLRGILHHANLSKTKKTVIIALNTGLNDMVGWHRIQVKIARFFAQEGFNFLRFDNFGIGESEGELQEGLVVENFARVETGLWADDAISAIKFINSKFPEHKVLLMGFCGGALTAIHAGAITEKIDGIINVAGPVTLSTTEYLNRKDPWTVKKNVESYKQKLMNFTSIKNFFTGKSDYAVVFKSIVSFIKHSVLGRYDQEKNSENGVDIDNLNYSLFDSFEKYMNQKKPLFFYYAGLDNATWGFKKYFLSKYKNHEQFKEGLCEFIEIEKANHIFSGQEIQEEMKAHLLNWTLKNVEAA